MRPIRPGPKPLRLDPAETPEAAAARYAQEHADWLAGHERSLPYSEWLPRYGHTVPVPEIDTGEQHESNREFATMRAHEQARQAAYAQWREARMAAPRSPKPLSELAGIYHTLGPEEGERARQHYLRAQAARDEFEAWNAGRTAGTVPPPKMPKLPTHIQDVRKWSGVKSANVEKARQERSEKAQADYEDWLQAREEQGPKLPGGLSWDDAAEQQAAVARGMDPAEWQAGHAAAEKKRQAELEEIENDKKALAAGLPLVTHGDKDRKRRDYMADLINAGQPTPVPLPELAGEHVAAGNAGTVPIYPGLRSALVAESVGPYGYVRHVPKPATMWLAPKNEFHQMLNEWPPDVVNRLEVADLGDKYIVRSLPPSGPHEHAVTIEPPSNWPGFAPSRNVFNLFVPNTHKLTPELRTSYMREQYGAAPGTTNWLVPDEAGNLVKHQLRDSAFVKLRDAINYGVPKQQELTPWRQPKTSPFDLNPFVERQPKTKKPAATPAVAAPPPTPVATPTPRPASPRAPRGGRRRTAAPAPLPTLAFPSQAPDEAQATAKQLEKQFQETPGDIDDPAKVGQWQDLGHAYQAAGMRQDAGLAYVNDLWHKPTGDANTTWSWLRNEDPNASPMPTGAELTADTANPTPSQGDMRRLAARLIQAGQAGMTPDALAQLPRASEYLERHERMLGVKPAWLAWQALSKHGDVLQLARARDRLLARMAENKNGLGLDPELDTPRFLRQSQMQSANVGHKMPEIGSAIQAFEASHQEPNWSAVNDLALAYANARLGNTTTANSILDRARQSMLAPGPNGEPHLLKQWLFNAYAHRIGEAIRGEPSINPLPSELMAQAVPQSPLGRTLYTDAMEQAGSGRSGDSFVTRRMKYSRILDPFKSVDDNLETLASHVGGKYKAALNAAMAINAGRVSDVAGTINNVLATPGDQDDENSALSRLLSFSTRGGESFALNMANRALIGAASTIGQRDQFNKAADLLTKAISIAAHYGQHELTGQLFDTAANVVRGQKEEDQYTTIKAIIGHNIKQLVRMGMGDQAHRFVEQMQALMQAKPPASGTKWLQQDVAWSAIANGWNSLGYPDQARPILDRVRQQIIQVESSPSTSSVFFYELVGSYLSAAAAGPSDDAAARIQEIGKLVPSYGRDKPGTLLLRSNARLQAQEAALLSLSHKAGLSDEVRKVLDQDEWNTRSRIHADMRQAMAGV